jgi:SOS response regulatory protein OraA/RecX
MDLSILQKVNELVEQGKSTEDIRHELQTSGISPETAEQALKEAGSNQTNQQPTQAAPTPLMPHHEKVIQPTPGFDPNDKS